MWLDPARFHAEAVACTATAGAQGAGRHGGAVAVLQVTDQGATLQVERSFDAPGAHAEAGGSFAIGRGLAGPRRGGGAFRSHSRDASRVVDGSLRGAGLA